MKHIELIKETYPLYRTTLETLRSKLKGCGSLYYVFEEILFGNVNQYGQLVDLKLTDSFSKLMTNVGDDPNLIIEELRTIDQINEKFFDVGFYISDSIYHNDGIPWDLISTRQHIRDNLPIGHQNFKIMLDGLEVNWYVLISLMEQGLNEGLRVEIPWITYRFNGTEWVHDWTDVDCETAKDMQRTAEHVVKYLNLIAKGA